MNPPEGQWSNSSVKVTIATKQQNLTIKYAEKKQSTGTKLTYTQYNNTAINVTEQDEEIFAQLTDGTNTSTDNATIKITNIDTQAPTVTITDALGKNGSIEVSDKTIKVKVTATDPNKVDHQSGQSGLKQINCTLNRK